MNRRSRSASSGVPVSAAAVSGLALPGAAATAAAAATEPSLSQHEEQDEAMRSARAPLTDLYHPYLVPSDTCLADARQRLETALQQTYTMRRAFTERVYEKYRICLKPPTTVDETLATIRADPITELRRRTAVNDEIRAEKEAEKRDTNRLNGTALLLDNNDMSAADLNVDHAEQLMYLSAGLHLMILPEAPVEQLQDEWLQSLWTDGRGPVDIVTGKRHAALSNAQATAGEVMLHRRRKADALRLERLARRQQQQQQQQQQLSNPQQSSQAGLSIQQQLRAAEGGGGGAASTAAAASVMGVTGMMGTAAAAVSAAGTISGAALANMQQPLLAGQPLVPLGQPTTTKPSLKKAASNKRVSSSTSTASGTSKIATKGRSASALTANALLSLDPSADQFDNISTTLVGATTTTTAGGASASAATSAAGSTNTNSSSSSSSTKNQRQRQAPTTAALIAKGVGSKLASAAAKSTLQLRMRHPYPESLGGKRRASSLGSASAAGSASNVVSRTTTGSSSAAAAAQAAFQQELVKQSLPPLPTPKDRLERKPLAVYTRQEAITERAKKSLQAVLGPFCPAAAAAEDSNSNSRRSETETTATQPQQEPNENVTKIGLLHNLWKLDNACQAQTAARQSNDHKDADVAVDDTESDTVDPLLTFMVLHSVGLLGSVQAQKDNRKPPPPSSESSILANCLSSLPTEASSAKLNTLRQKVLSGASSSSSSSTVTASVFARDDKKRSMRGGPDDSPRQSKRLRRAVEPSVTAKDEEVEEEAVQVSTDLAPERIRGGGEAEPDSKEKTDSSQPGADSRQKTGSAESASNKKAQGGGVGVGGVGSQPDTKTDPESGRKRSGSVPSKSSASSSGAATSAASSSKRSESGSAPMSAYDYVAVAQSMPAAAHGYMTPPEGFPHAANMNSLHMAQQLGQGAPFHHPAAGDIAGNVAYLNALHQRPHEGGFDFSSFAQSSLAAMGLARQNQAVADARAMYARDQQAGALLRGAAAFAPGAAPPFGQVGGPQSAAAMAAFLPNPSALIGHGQYPVPGPMGATLPQSMYHHPAPVPPDASAKGDSSTSSHGEAKDAARKAKSPEKKADEAQKPAASSQPSSKKVIPQSKSSVAMHPASEPAKQASSADGKSDGKPKSQSASSLSSNVPNPNPADTAKGSKARDEAAMKFIKPGAPPALAVEEANLILAGKFHEVVARANDRTKKTAALEYLISVGTAVPIPKAIVLSPLKDRLNAPGLKNVGNSGQPAFPRDIAVSAIMVWLWANNEHTFRRAFEKSGRIDVDPDCKWLIQAAVETGIRTLTGEIANERATSKGPFAEQAARKAQPVDDGKSATVSKNVEIHTATIVSRALMAGMKVNVERNAVIPVFQSLVDYLDEARLCALRWKSQERNLLATLISRRTMMSESFSNAYVSAMIRAGEALGHSKLAEVVQNEDVGASTMLPFDYFTDETKEWDDPCKPPDGGYEPGTSAVELGRRAHARAMIHKSLKKLQDRHNIRGGASSGGPYADPGSNDSRAAGKSPRGGIKRKSSFSGPTVPPGTGSASAKSWAVYEPQHVSEALDWNPNYVENSPYGRHHAFEQPRSLSLSLSARTEPKTGKKLRRSSSMAPPNAREPIALDADGNFPRSTRELKWEEVAPIFQPVDTPKAPPSKASGAHGHHASVPVKFGETIIAPFCRQYAESSTTSEEDLDESDTEEDISEATVLARHEVDLGIQLKKRDAYLEARRRQQDRRKNRS